jgi:uridylate kinase
VGRDPGNPQFARLRFSLFKPRARLLGSRNATHRMSFPESSPRSFKRAILKLSGEALREPGSTDNISPEIVERIASEVRDALAPGDLELGIVVGGGNFWRGAAASARGMDRATADYVGMLATVMNSLALQGSLEHHGVTCVVQSAIEMKNVAETYIRRKAERHLGEKRVVIFAAGTGSPFFSTDTTAALRASEMSADVVFKATMVDGVYDSDPKKNPAAKRYSRVGFHDCISRQLKVMDSTAFSLCMDNHIPIVIFDLGPAGNITKALRGEDIGTVVTSGETVLA